MGSRTPGYRREVLGESRVLPADDGTISFDEFAPWFIETAKHVGDFHKKAHAKQKAKK